MRSPPRYRMGLCRILALFCAWWALWLAPARAHDVRGTALYLDMGQHRVDLELLVPLAQLQLALPNANNEAALRAYLAQHVSGQALDGRPFALTLGTVTREVVAEGDQLRVLASLSPPPGASPRWLRLGCDLVAHQVVTHNLYVFVRRDLRGALLGDAPQLLAVLHYQSKSVVVDRSGGSYAAGLQAVFWLGMRHIAEGADHLLFLLMLLLPACLLAQEGRWGGSAGLAQGLRRTLRIVTAFTVGHSLTLLLGSLLVTRLPVAQVEVLIAVSVLLSALHALRPIFGGREALIAGGFGLVHGLAFASALQGLGFDAATLWLSVLGFNLGVEAVQLALVLAVLPLLVWLSRRARYAALRCAGALVGAAAACVWIVERLR